MVSLLHAEQTVLNNTFLKRNEISYVDKTPSKPLGFQPFGQDGLSFLDLLDIANPLHHIPIIGPIYRSITGDIINPLPRIAGSALFGGPIGAGLSAADVILEVATGRDSGAHILTLLPDQLSNLAPVESGGQKDKNIAAISEVKEVIVSNRDAKTKSKTDPVSAWARAEIAYRSGLAARQTSVASYENLAL
tara:strand:+ start:27 stop:599 length:573 start_codon:yes stop_codon:yes gene_type:complete